MELQNALITVHVGNVEKHGDGAFCKGIYKLLDGIRQDGSLNAAAKNMSMAYSKAWAAVKKTEETLGVKLVDRDGAHGSTLTEAGEWYVNYYKTITNAANRSAKATAQKFMTDHPFPTL